MVDANDEAELFRAATADVRPLRHEKTPPVRKRIAPIPMQSYRNDLETLDESLTLDPHQAELETGEELWFARPGVQRKVIRKLRRGQFSVGSELDLHGMFVAHAKTAVAEFFAYARARNIRCVRIIHGKGLRSANGQPVLKGQLDIWLRRNKDVVAFSSARPADGGTGAVYVLLQAN